MSFRTILVGVAAFGSLIGSANGITTTCHGGGNKFSYELSIFADAKYTGGFKLISRYNGSFPTVTGELGTTRVKQDDNEVLEVGLTTKAHIFDPGRMDIPSFLSEEKVKEDRSVTIDLSDRRNIRATLLGVTLNCK